MHATFSFGALVLSLTALIAKTHAFHVESGTACSGVGSACTYVSDDSSFGGSATTTVRGFCAADLHCASNGAQCSSDDECYNYCGTDGTCGGEGAGCNSQSSFAAGQTGIACAADFTCSEDGAVGSCLPSSQVTLAASSSAAAAPAAALAPSQLARRHRRRSPSFQNRQVRAADLRKRV